MAAAMRAAARPCWRANIVVMGVIVARWLLHCNIGGET